jgi:hypothetical protein
MDVVAETANPLNSINPSYLALTITTPRTGVGVYT